MWKSSSKNSATGARGAQFNDMEGMRMRPMAMSLPSEEDVKAVAHYVGSMTPVRHAATLPGDPKAGAALYATCSSCHGDKGAGNPDLKAPRIGGHGRLVPGRAAQKIQEWSTRRESEGSRRQIDAPDGAHAAWG